MDDPIKPRADTARNKPRMRPLRPVTDLDPRWYCERPDGIRERPDGIRCGFGRTQIEAWEAAHGVLVDRRTQRSAGSAS